MCLVIVNTVNRYFGKIVELIILFIITPLFLLTCQQNIKTNLGVHGEEIKALTERFIYGKEEEARIEVLDDLTKMGVKVRYNAIDELINASEKNFELFPRGNDEKKQSLLKEIKTAYLNDDKAKNKKECVKERMMHLRMLNRLLTFGMQYKMYYEVAEILYQKYLYGTLWFQESLNIYKNKSAASEFTHARNAAIANLHLLLKIAKEERTKNFIRKCLEEIDEM